MLMFIGWDGEGFELFVCNECGEECDIHHDCQKPKQEEDTL